MKTAEEWHEYWKRYYRENIEYFRWYRKVYRNQINAGRRLRYKKRSSVQTARAGQKTRLPETEEGSKMKIICTSCAHYCTTCGNCGVFHIGVTGMNVAPCRYYKQNDKPELPEEFRTIIALIKFEDVPPMPLTGYMAYISTNTTDHFHEPALFTYMPKGHAFAWKLVLKWDYIEPYSTEIQHESEVQK